MITILTFANIIKNKWRQISVIEYPNAIYISVDSDGKMIARLNQKIDSESAKYNSNPSTRIHTEINVPSKGIHKDVLQQYPAESPQTENGNRRSIRMDSLQENGNNVSTYKYTARCWKIFNQQQNRITVFFQIRFDEFV